MTSYYLSVIAILIVILVLLRIKIKADTQGIKSNGMPVLTVQARVLGKRTRTIGEYSNYYYVTFGLENGERVELSVLGETSGMLIEGDEGTLTYQEKRYVSFERKNSGAPVGGAQ